VIPKVVRGYQYQTRKIKFGSQYVELSRLILLAALLQKAI
jgi:hypothetical protein